MITNYILRSIVGPYSNHAISLPPKGDLVIGRSRMCEISIEDRYLSRFHAKIHFQEGHSVLYDLDSKNGTFVNGERGRKFEVKTGDVLVTGSCAFRLEQSAEESIPQASFHTPILEKALSGLLTELPISDLLQLLSTSQRCGVLVLQTQKNWGQIYLRHGQIYYATIDDGFEICAKKALFRLLTWKTGTFFLEPPDHRKFINEIKESTEALLREGARQAEQIQELDDQLTYKNGTLVLAQPLIPQLRALTASELDLVQLAMNLGVPQKIIDKASHTDAEAVEGLLGLLSKKYLVLRNS